MSACSGPTSPDLSFAPDELAYVADVSLLQQSTTVTATAAYPEASISVQGVPVASGMPSEPVSLALGDNVVSIDVTHPSGLARSYQITVRRALPIAQYAYGKASNTGEGDWFGYNVALDGDTLVVGAPYEDSATTGVNGSLSDNGAQDSGAVYVFRRSGSAWLQEAYIKASNTDAGDYFGVSAALGGDTLAVGAFEEGSAATGVDGNQADNSASVSGAVYVFRRSGTAWQQEAYIKASNTGVGDRFGISVALDGDTLAVGAYCEDSVATGVNGSQSNDGAFVSGAAYVFRRSGSTWLQEAYIKASNTGEADFFGSSVALDGDTLAVGAGYEDSAATGINGNQADDRASDSGAVYVFRRSGSTWDQEAYVKASNTGAGDRFGWHITLDGDTLAVGAGYEDSAATGVNGNQADNSTSDSGAVYVFRRSGSTWLQQAYVKASNTGANDRLGGSVALDGDTLAVGAQRESSAATGINGNQADNSTSDSGAVYIFH